MEYLCKNSKNEEAIQIYLKDLSMEIKSPGKYWVVFYSSIDTVSLTKRSGDFYSLQITTSDKRVFNVSNRYIESSGHSEDKSVAYSMFVRVLHMHLKTKSRAQINCRKVFHIPEWQKILVVLLLFAISYLLDFIGARLFHPAIHGVALSAIALLIITLSEKNRAIENFSSKDIPREFLPA
jgi:hypothetical protein